MNVKRATTAVLMAVVMTLAGGVGLASSTPPPGADDTFNGCFDYSTTAGNGGSYSGPMPVASTTDSVTVLLFKYALVDPSCKNATYTFTVVSGDNLAGQVLWQDVRSGDGITQTFTENVALLSGPSSICVYGTTSVNNKVYDRAPETGCLSLSLTGGAGSNSYW
jgi:hypothetical protein